MTQTELATRAGIRQGHLSKLESGQRPNPVVATTLALAGALGVPLSAILTASPEEIAAAVQNV